MNNTTNTENRVMTITEAARQIGRSRDFVRSLIADQQINARQHRGRWYVNAASLNDWTSQLLAEPCGEVHWRRVRS